jgi:hypothetical protein
MQVAQLANARCRNSLLMRFVVAKQPHWSHGGAVLKAFSLFYQLPRCPRRGFLFAGHAHGLPGSAQAVVQRFSMMRANQKTKAR